MRIDETLTTKFRARKNPLAVSREDFRLGGFSIYTQDRLTREMSARCPLATGRKLGALKLPSRIGPPIPLASLVNGCVSGARLTVSDEPREQQSDRYSHAERQPNGRNCPASCGFSAPRSCPRQINHAISFGYVYGRLTLNSTLLNKNKKKFFTALAV